MSDAAYEVIGSSAGYEVGRRGATIILVNRATRGPALVTWIVGGLSLFALGHAALWPSLGFAGKVARRPAVIAGALLGGLGVALFTIARAAFRLYRRRRDRPIDELPGYRAELDAGELWAAGQVIARLTEVEIDTPRNLGDSTQGSMRWVRLRWPGGEARVYSAAASEAQRVARVLTDLGVARAAR